MLIVSPEFKYSNEMLTITTMLSGTPLHQELQFLSEIYSDSAKHMGLTTSDEKRTLLSGC
jgi:hypothetical protein